MGHVLPDRLFWARDDGADPRRRRIQRTRPLKLLPMTPDTDRNLQLFQRAQQVIPGGVNSPCVPSRPWAARRASWPDQGAYFWDANGKRYIDYIGSWGPMILGHGHPAVLEAVQRPPGRLLVWRPDRTRESNWPKKSSKAVPSMDMVRLVSSGTEAGMSHPRLARGATGPPKILIKFEGCYHGHADALLVKAGSGPGHLWQPHQRRRAAGWCSTPWCWNTTTSSNWKSLRPARQGSGLPDHRADRRQHELRARLCPFVSAAANCARSTAPC